MNIAFVGCGFVADYYASTLANHPILELVGVMDRDANRAEKFANYWNVNTVYPTLQALLDDRRVEIVVNLTNPSSHFEVSKACLQADCHVYSEKPLAVDFNQAEELVQISEERKLYLSSAPCNVLGETAQTVWKALREGILGKIRLVYANLDEGMVHRFHYKNWFSKSGAPWPYKNEFEVGCTLEHAGYYLAWLATFFGPARTITSYSSCLIPDKNTDVPLEVTSPDFAVGIIEFGSGVVARLTSSIVAPRDHSLSIIGDEGVLSVKDCWNYGSPVYIKRHLKYAVAEKYTFLNDIPGLAVKRYPLVRKFNPKYHYKGIHSMDFSRGVAELASAIQEQRESRISARFALHVNELVLATQYPEIMGVHRKLISTFNLPEPMPWAK